MPWPGFLRQIDATGLLVLPMAYHFIVSIVAYVRYGVTIVCCPDMLARTAALRLPLSSTTILPVVMSVATFVA